MEDRSTGMSWIAVLFVIIVIFAIFGGNFGGGWGWNRGNNPYPPQEGCNRVSNCEIERQEIADTARTQYLIEQQSNDTRMAINASTEAITSQASRIYEQRLQETIFDLKMENQNLKNGIFTKEQTDALAAKISDCCCVTTVFRAWVAAKSLIYWSISFAVISPGVRPANSFFARASAGR